MFSVVANWTGLNKEEPENAVANQLLTEGQARVVEPREAFVKMLTMQ